MIKYFEGKKSTCTIKRKNLMRLEAKARIRLSDFFDKHY